MNGLCVYWDGSRRWYLNGQLHRTDGPAVEYADGTRCWYVNGERHRTDGPAIDGPAAVYADGDKEWYVNGVAMTEQQWKVAEKEKLFEVVLALLPLRIPPYHLLPILEFSHPHLTTNEHHRELVSLLLSTSNAYAEKRTVH